MYKWQLIKPGVKSDRRRLVTNNIRARDAWGDPANVWISFIFEDAARGCFYGYDGANKIHNLTHFCELPQEGLAGEVPPKPQPSGKSRVKNNRDSTGSRLVAKQMGRNR